jgi:hypothetical protein
VLHTTCTSTTSNSSFRVRLPQCDLLPRLLGKDEDKDTRVLKHQHICEAKRGARPSSHRLAHVLGLCRIVLPAVCICDCARVYNVGPTFLCIYSLVV